MKGFLSMAVILVLAVAGYRVGKDYYLRPGLASGIEASEISGVLQNGQSFRLTDLKGKYVLLDFWGSWCKPCRTSNRQLVELYATYRDAGFEKGSGFEIVSVAIEKQEKNWKAAVQADGLSWPYHLLCTNLFESPIPMSYNVKQIPTKFLIDPDGIIIAVDPSIDQIMKELETSRR